MEYFLLKYYNIMMKNLLLVDDERMFLMSLSESLMQTFKDINIFTAENGEEAIRILNSIPISFLLTDLQMPVVNGFGLLSHVREFHPEVPVVVMTAYVNGEIIDRLNSLGFSDIVEKPIEFEELIRKIKDRI